MQRAIGPAKRRDHNHGQGTIKEAYNKTQEEYPQFRFIPSLQSERIPVFQASLRK